MASDLSFHCIICFETFDSTTIYPVVLPCGHTYVCCVCANRLEKCMECRTSLFLPEEAKPLPQVSRDRGSRRGQPSWYTGRIQTSNSSSRSVGGRVSSYRSTSSADSSSRGSSYQGNSPSKTQPRDRKRFPLPKNLVLISLLETMYSVGENERRAGSHLVRAASKSGRDKEDVDIEIATSRLSSACGTYAVTAREGVSIFTRSVSSSSSSRAKYLGSSSSSFSSSGAHGQGRQGFYKKVLSKSKNKENFIDQQVRHILDEMVVNSDSCCPTADTLNYRDKVQVVCISDTWAILARGKGFVASNQLVKVGPPTDASCRAEGLLYSLSDKHSSLKEEEGETKRLLIELKRELEEALMCEDSTIVRAPPDTCTVLETRDPKTETSEKPSADLVSITTVPSNVESTPNRSTKKKKRLDSASKIDFRTGMSGHHALGNYHKNTNHSGRFLRVSKMSAHSALNM